MDTRRTIQFGNARDRKTGYLCNGARYCFRLSGKDWFSVEHYIYANRFAADAPLYEKIRVTPELWAVRHLMRPQVSVVSTDKRLQKVRQFPKGMKSKEDWGHGLAAWYRDAIAAKFFQNQRLLQRLLHTGNAILQDTTCHFTGKILEKIRDQRREEGEHKQFMRSAIELESTCDTLDMPYAQLRPDDFRFVNKIITTAQQLARKENNEWIYAEFVRQALKTLFPWRSQYLIDLHRTRPFSALLTMSNFRKIIAQIHRLFSERDPYQTYDGTGSELVGEFLRWKAVYASPKELGKFTAVLNGLTPHAKPEIASDVPASTHGALTELRVDDDATPDSPSGAPLLSVSVLADLSGGKDKSTVEALGMTTEKNVESLLEQNLEEEEEQEEKEDSATSGGRSELRSVLVEEEEEQKNQSNQTLSGSVQEPDTVR